MIDVLERAPETALPTEFDRLPEAATTSRSRPWLGLSAILAATLMNLLDSTVSNVAAPSIRADLGGSLATLQWIAAGYTLALAVGLLTGGRLGDMFGRKRMLVIGVTGFMAASVACGVATSPEMLIGARVLHGTVFFSSIGAQPDVNAFMDAARHVTLLTIGLTAATFACGFLLPHRARGYQSAN